MSAPSPARDTEASPTVELELARWCTPSIQYPDRAVRKWGPRAAAALAAVVVLEQLQRLPSFDKREARARVDAITRRVDSSCGVFFVSGAPPSNEIALQLDSMWASLETGVPTINGYSGNQPRGWDLRDVIVSSPEDKARLRSALAEWVVTRKVAPNKVCWIEVPPGR